MEHCRRNMRGIALFLNVFGILCIISLPQLASAYGVREQLWLNVVYPEEIAYYYKIVSANDFGGVLRKTLRGIPLVVAEPWHACSKFNNGYAFRGRVVLVVRGECSFVTKALNVELQKAIAVIVTNNDRDDIDIWIDMSDDLTGRAKDVTIPAFYLLGKDGHKIKESLSSSYYNAALINIPVNVTDPSTVSQPKWDLW